LYEQKFKTPDEVDWTYWSERNLQTLCRKCHKEKTKDDMKRLRELNEKNLQK
jgi:5-methylcytosine-specific restriction endonuclease McrA